MLKLWSNQMTHTTFTTITRRLQRESPPMRLYEKAKRLGIWNPSEIDFSQDIHDWRRLTAEEQDLILRLTAMFQAGEEAVTLDLLPLIMAIAREGRLEEEMYLTTFLWEEAKHTDFFGRFLEEVAGSQADLCHYHTDNYRCIFYEALPRTMGNLQQDASPAAQVRASVTYNMIVEGVLAETGYHAYLNVLEANNLMPGTVRGVRLLKQDESRHIAYAVFLLSRLLAVDPALWEVVDETMNELLLPALGIIGEAFDCYDPMPFGLIEDDFIYFATGQFQKRIERLEKACGADLEEISRVTHAVIEEDDA
jgi:ribonucleoside-diphosphate reductase beta chain